MQNQLTPEPFLKLITSHKGILYKISNSFCKEEADRKDLTQEIIIKLWQSFKAQQPLSQESTWIYRVALNTAISFYRKEKTRSKINIPVTEHLIQIEQPNDSTNTYAALQSSYLHKFLMELKELDRALMILYLEEKSHKEIAAIMGITTSNVATKISRIKLFLKEKFSNINF